MKIYFYFHITDVDYFDDLLIKISKDKIRFRRKLVIIKKIMNSIHNIDFLKNYNYNRDKYLP